MLEPRSKCGVFVGVSNPPWCAWAYIDCQRRGGCCLLGSLCNKMQMELTTCISSVAKESYKAWRYHAGGPVTKPPGPGLDDTALMTLLVAHKAG